MEEEWEGWRESVGGEEGRGNGRVGGERRQRLCDFEKKPGVIERFRDHDSLVEKNLGVVYIPIFSPVFTASRRNIVAVWSFSDKN